MAREIKFRVWNKHINKMQFVDALNFSEEDGLIVVNETLLRGKFELMQFTGLTDTNGKDIYEGDILNTDFNDIAIVKFDHGCFYINTSEDYETIGLWEWCDHMSTIIGNIHEPPELLGDRNV